MAKLKLEKLKWNIKQSLETTEMPKCPKLWALVTNQLSVTMSCMFDSFLAKKQFGFAKLAAFWSLRKALKFERNFSNIARSFANVMKIIFVTGDVGEFLWLQKAALEQVARALFVDSVDLVGLTCVARLYHSIMMCQ